MAYDGSTFAAAIAGETPWTRAERLSVLVGALGLGFLIGLAATIFAGRVAPDPRLSAAPALVLALYCTGRTWIEAHARGARGCAVACALHAAALVTWPGVLWLSALAPHAFLVAPALAFSSLVLLASCWSGGPGTVYRTLFQAALTAAFAAHQTLFVFMGS